MTASVRDIAFRLAGFIENIDGAASEKQTAKIRKYLQELLEALDTPSTTITPIIRATQAPHTSNGGATDIMAQVADLKREGQAKAAAGAGPVALDAGPPAAMRKK